MGKMTSVALDDRMASFVAEQVNAGEFGTEAEVIQAGLELLEERAVKLAELRALLAAGEVSGWHEDFDIRAFTDELKARHSA